MISKGAASTGRIRTTPFTSRVESAGVKQYTSYNHMLLPTVFESLEADYEHLIKYVQLWDVSCQRQVEISGYDAGRLTQLMTPRDLTNIAPLQGKYAPLCDETGAILNDPIIIKLDDNRWWISIADADIKLWAKGIAYGMNLDVTVIEPDVWPLAVQGPLAEELMARVFGTDVVEIRFFRGRWLKFEGQEMLVMRSGWSKQGGFEIYLNDFSLGEALWDALASKGQDLYVRAGCPNQIERLESGLLSYGGDMSEKDNPFECGLGKYVDLEAEVESISLPALRRLKGKYKKVLTGIAFPEVVHVPGLVLVEEGRAIGKITAQVWSPKFEEFIMFAMVDRERVEASPEISVDGVIGKFVPLVREG